MMGKVALTGFHDGERQLDQSPKQDVWKIPRSGYAVIIGCSSASPTRLGAQERALPSRARLD